MSSFYFTLKKKVYYKTPLSLTGMYKEPRKRVAITEREYTTLLKKHETHPPSFLCAKSYKSSMYTLSCHEEICLLPVPFFPEYWMQMKWSVQDVQLLLCHHTPAYILIQLGYLFDRWTFDILTFRGYPFGVFHTWIKGNASMCYTRFIQSLIHHLLSICQVTVFPLLKMHSVSVLRPFRDLPSLLPILPCYSVPWIPSTFYLEQARKAHSIPFEIHQVSTDMWTWNGKNWVAICPVNGLKKAFYLRGVDDANTPTCPTRLVLLNFCECVLLLEKEEDPADTSDTSPLMGDNDFLVNAEHAKEHTDENKPNLLLEEIDKTHPT